MRPEVLWTDLSIVEIAQHLAACGTPVSVTVVTQLLRRAGYVKRKAQKRQATGKHPDKDQQFHYIAELRSQYEHSGNPIVSTDQKEGTAGQFLP